MNHTRKWCCVVALVWAIGTTNNAIAYNYIQSDPYYYPDYEPPISVHTSTRTEEAEASGSAQEGGYCSISTRTYTWASDGDSASAGTGSYAHWDVSWSWNGPPGTAPGGTLDWVADGGGTASIGGWAYPTLGGSASASADASAAEGGGGSGGSGGAGCGWATGSVQNNNMGSISGNAYSTYDPEGRNTDFDPEPDYGEFVGFAWWQCCEGGSTVIASGTSYVYFGGDAEGSNGSSANAGYSGDSADSQSSTSADVSLSASFP